MKTIISLTIFFIVVAVIILMGVACGAKPKPYNFIIENREKFYYIVQNCKEFDCYVFHHEVLDMACVDYKENEIDRRACVSVKRPCPK